MSDLFYPLDAPRVDASTLKVSARIISTCKDLGLPVTVAIDACIVFHRACSRISFFIADTDNSNIVTCCIFLACKLNETPKPLSTVLNAACGGHSPPESEMKRAKIEVFELERVLLIATGFQIHSVVRPTCIAYLIAELNALGPCVCDRVRNKSRSVLLDLHRTDLCCRLPQYAIAAAAVYIADRLVNPETNGKLAVDGWYTAFGLARDQLQCAVDYYRRLTDKPSESSGIL